MSKELTRDASAFIAILYREYLNRRKNGATIDQAMEMGDDDVIQKSLTPKLPLDDVTHLCWYLEDRGILRVFPGDDRANDVAITDDGIAYMENRFPKGLDDALTLIGKLAPLLSWLS